MLFNERVTGIKFLYIDTKYVSTFGEALSIVALMKNIFSLENRTHFQDS